jgi:hypothetical protein
MSTRYTNVIVHLSGPIDPTKRTEIEQAVAAEPGVGRAGTSPTFERLILIDYDPVVTNAQYILASVRSRGVGARLIGM